MRSVKGVRTPGHTPRGKVTKHNLRIVEESLLPRERVPTAQTWQRIMATLQNGSSAHFLSLADALAKLDTPSDGRIVVVLTIEQARDLLRGKRGVTFRGSVKRVADLAWLIDPSVRASIEQGPPEGCVQVVYLVEGFVGGVAAATTHFTVTSKVEVLPR